jgi:Flp pilus assembly pilin Flp
LHRSQDEADFDDVWRVPMFRLSLQFVKDESGATVIEYAMMLALVAIFIISAVASVGTRLSENMDLTANSLK